MNYRYKLLEKDYVLSQEEHDIVTESIKQKQSSVFLRNGTLMINVNFVAAISTTDDLTDIEKEKKAKVLLLTEPEGTFIKGRKKATSILMRTHKEFYDRMKWEHEDNCPCKKVPF